MELPIWKTPPLRRNYSREPRDLNKTPWGGEGIDITRQIAIRESQIPSLWLLGAVRWGNVGSLGKRCDDVQTPFPFVDRWHA